MPSRTDEVQDTLDEILAEASDPYSDLHSLYEVEPMQVGGSRVFFNAPVAEELIERIANGSPHLYAENAFIIHVLS